MSRNSLVFKWGLIGGMVSIIVGILAYLLNLQDSKMIQYLSVLIMLACVVFSHFEFRDKLNNGRATFGELFRVGFLVSLVIALISMIWFYIFVNFIDTDLVFRTLNKAEADMVARELSAAEVEKAMEITKKFVTPIYMTLIGFFYTAILGLIVTLVSALVVKNDIQEPLELNETEN